MHIDCHQYHSYVLVYLCKDLADRYRISAAFPPYQSLRQSNMENSQSGAENAVPASEAQGRRGGAVHTSTSPSASTLQHCMRRARIVPWSISTSILHVNTITFLWLLLHRWGNAILHAKSTMYTIVAMQTLPWGKTMCIIPLLLCITWLPVHRRSQLQSLAS